MTRIMRLSIVAVSLAIVIGALASLALVLERASAQTTTPMMLSYPPAGTTPAPMVVDVDTTGGILVRGVVRDSGANTITIDSWGGTWTIRTHSTSVVFSPSTNTTGDMSAIRAGDFVGVSGIVAADGAWTADATIVRDWTTTPYGTAGSTDASSSMTTPSSTIQTQVPPAAVTPTTTTTAPTTINPFIPTIPNVQVTTSSTSPSSLATTTGATTWTGSASVVGTDSFTLTTGSGSQYAVLTDASTTISTLATTSTTLSSMQTNDSVQVDGVMNSDGTISASAIRDISR